MARILIADDDIDQVTVQRKLLEAMGYEVGTALTPAAALSELQRRPPDVIVVDLRMPTVEDGLELIRAVRQTGTVSPLLVLSGWPDDLYGSPEESLVSRVLVKGNTRELLQAIQELL